MNVAVSVIQAVHNYLIKPTMGTYILSSQMASEPDFSEKMLMVVFFVFVLVWCAGVISSTLAKKMTSPHPVVLFVKRITVPIGMILLFVLFFWTFLSRFF